MEDHDGCEEEGRLPGVESTDLVLVSRRSLEDQNKSNIYIYIFIPDVVAIPLQDQEYHSTNRRKRQIRQTSLVIQPQAQTRIELADLGGICAGHGRSPTSAAAAASEAPEPAAGQCAVAAGGAVEVAAPCALGLRVLQGRRAAGGGGDCGGREGAAREVGGGARGGHWGAGVLGGRGLIGCKVHGCW